MADGAPGEEWKLRGPLSLSDFEIGATLGTGSFGRVRFATHKATGRVWAIKMLKKAEVMQQQQVDHMMSEKDILTTLDHPFVVKMAATFQDERFLYMVLEFVIGGEFFTHLRRAGRLDNDTARFFAAQITSVFAHIHEQSIIYRDLKPENLLLDARGFLKITDFGFAKRVPFKTFTLCGTPEYIAPEVLMNKGHGKGVDWWTLGILLYEILSGQPPFVDEEPMAIYNKIMHGKVVYPRYFDRAAKSLIKKLLATDLTKRYGCLKDGAEDVKKHKWFAGMDWAALQTRSLTAPIVPQVRDEKDTSNFDSYPDEPELPPKPDLSGGDPFENF